MTNPLDKFRLDGRTALVTGARREIGAAIAQGLAAVGARVAIHHAGTAQEATDAAATVQRCGNGAQAFAADFSQKGTAEQLAVDVTAAFGQWIATGPGSTYYVSSDAATWTGRFTGTSDA